MPNPVLCASALLAFAPSAVAGDPPAGEIGYVRDTTTTTGPSSFPAVRIDVGVSDWPFVFAGGLLFEETFGVGVHSGLVLTLDSGPELEHAVGLLTDGTNDWISFDVTMVTELGSEGGGAGTSIPETGIRSEDYSCAAPPDLAGTTITGFQLVVNHLVVSQPGEIVCEQEGFDGECTHVDAAVTLRIMGHAGILATETVRLGTPPNPSALQPGLSGGPSIGGVWAPVLDHASFAPNADADFLVISLGASNVPTEAGTLLCDLGTSFIALPVVAPGVPFAVGVPDNCDLVGTSVCAQGGSIDADGNVELANAIDVTLGSI